MPHKLNRDSTTTSKRRGPMTIAIQWTIGLALALVILKFLVIWLQPRLAFYPSKGPTPPPPRFAELTTKTADGELLAGWQTELNPEGPVFIYFCGNAGNLLDRTMLLSDLVAAGGQVVAFNYRGYGQSTGSPTEVGIYKDADAIYQLVTGELGIDPSRIILWGHSIGGAVAAHLAVNRPVAALVLESTFRSAKVMAGRMMPLLPAGPFMTYQFDNESHVQELTIPILFIHGTTDRVTPADDSKRLYDLAPGPKELWLVPNAGHNDVSDIAGQDFYSRLLSFAEQSLAKIENP